MIIEMLRNPPLMFLVGFALLAAAPCLDRSSRRTLKDLPVFLGVFCELLAARYGLRAAGAEHCAGVAAAAHLAWTAVTIVWFQLKYAGVRVPESADPKHHCKPKLFISSGNQHYRNRKNSKSLLGWINAYLIVSIDIVVTDSQIDVQGYATGAYLWAGFWPTGTEARLHYQAVISCVERNGICSPSDSPSGPDKAIEPPTALNMFFNWYNKNNEVGCYPQFIATVDGDPVSVSPAIPGGGWVTITVGNAKVTDQSNLGHFAWICPKEGEHYVPSIEPDQPKKMSWDPEVRDKQIEEWLPK